MTFVHVCLKNDVSFFFLAKPLRIQNILSHKTFYGLGKTFFKIALLILSKCISGRNLCNKRKSSNGILEFFSKIMLMLLLVSQILDNVQSTIKKAKLLIVFGWRGENKDMSTFYLLWIYVRYKHLLIIKGRAHKTLSVTSVPRGVEILGSIVLDIYWTFPINLCFRCMKIKSICFFFDMKMVLVKILMEAAFTCKIVLIFLLNYSKTKNFINIFPKNNDKYHN